MEAARAQGGCLIIGAGIAGLWTALQMAPRPVTLITAGRLGEGSSLWAQGGLAAAVGDGDSADAHAEDTLAAGVGLSSPEAVRVLTEEGPGAVAALETAGVAFDRNEGGELVLGREAAHGTDRIVHVGGDEAGAAIMRALVSRAAATPSITIHERVVAEKLLTDDHGGAAGCLCWDIEGQRPLLLEAGDIVLASGGVGGLFSVTTNPLVSLGHGIALAAEAGAALRDLEFVQFHPTGLDLGRDPAPLATEAIRGAGGILLDANGHRFMPELHADGELAPRDEVARGVAKALAATGGAFLDAREALGESFAERFPTVNAALAEAGIDASRELIPVAPAAHYHMGGVLTDLEGRSTVPGLYAVGECASTGVHGANRLASNSLLEAIVFGTRAACHLGGREERATPAPPPLPRRHHPPQSLQPLRRLMAEKAGLLRSAGGLKEAVGIIRQQSAETVGGTLARRTAELILTAALAREESRGAHQRADHPELAPTAQHTLTTIDPQTGEARISMKEVV
ncbi:L-aspartate oxidase [Parvularcula maris]|uniref:L-aspartate oxidase n=1 Tax=Parvularcula maris TaxID=2965077 RepID=A0A9X2RK12_9PROT|nr:L-aspartate oxidase [Parvularcula maris]